ncbi:MAG: type II toxin-antitoxin system VapC family toxin [Pseudomonadota bacterium]
MKCPDVNVLLFAVNQDTPQHKKARAWLEEAFAQPAGVGFAWNALLGFLRLATRPGIFARPLEVETALGVVQAWLTHPAGSVLNPTPRHADVLGRLLIGAAGGGNLVSDAHLAALAIEHDAELGTFDRDFKRFSGLRCALLG